MGRSQIFEGLFSAMGAHPTLIELLGAKTATNLRLYRSFSQFQSFLLGPPIYEPMVAEGWLVLEETAPGLNTSRAQYDSIYEIMDLSFHVFATTHGVADDVSDVLDTLFNWTIEQQRDTVYGNYYVFFSRAFQTSEKYAKEITLAQKIRQYRLELVLAEQVA